MKEVSKPTGRSPAHQQPFLRAGVGEERGRSGVGRHRARLSQKKQPWPSNGRRSVQRQHPSEAGINVAFPSKVEEKEGKEILLHFSPPLAEQKGAGGELRRSRSSECSTHLLDGRVLSVFRLVWMKPSLPLFLSSSIFHEAKRLIPPRPGGVPDIWGRAKVLEVSAGFHTHSPDCFHS